MSNNKNEDKTIALKAVLAIGLMMFWMVRSVLKAVAWTVATVLGMVEKLSGQNEDREMLARKPAANRKVSVAKDFQPTVAVDMASSIHHDFKVADRITSITLEPQVGVIHLRAFNEERIIRCDLVIHEPKLRTLMQGRRHALPDIQFDPKFGMDAVKEQAIADAQMLFDKFGEKMRLKQKNAQVVSERRPAEEQKPLQAAPKEKAARQQAVQPPKQAVKQALQALAKNEPPAKEEAKTTAYQANKFDAKPVVNVTYEGELVSMGRRKFSPPGKTPFETFEAKIRLESGIDVPLRGAELERELEHLNVEPGQKISVTPMGKVPVDLANGQVGVKNVYRVERLQ